MPPPDSARRSSLRITPSAGARDSRVIELLMCAGTLYIEASSLAHADLDESSFQQPHTFLPATVGESFRNQPCGRSDPKKEISLTSFRNSARASGSLRNPVISPTNRAVEIIHHGDFHARVVSLMRHHAVITERHDCFARHRKTYSSGRPPPAGAVGVSTWSQRDKASRSGGRNPESEKNCAHPRDT